MGGKGYISLCKFRSVRVLVSTHTCTATVSLFEKLTNPTSGSLPVRSRHARSVVEAHSRCGGGAIEARPRRGRGMPETRPRYAHGAVEILPRCSRGTLVVWSRCTSGTLTGAVPVLCGTLTFYRAVLYTIQPEMFTGNAILQIAFGGVVFCFVLLVFLCLFFNA